MKKLLTLLLALSFPLTSLAAFPVFRIWQGGTATSTAPTYGQLLIGDGFGRYALTATSSLGLISGASGSTGYLQFNTGGSFNADQSLFWDNSNKRLGIGTTSPYTALSVVGASDLGNSATAGYFFATTTATSTFSGGVNLVGGDCFAIAGTCLQTYIQNAAAYKSAANYATAAVLPGTPTYSNGSSGVGATLIEVGFGALVVDGQAVTLGQRILVKNEADQTTNGIYTVTTVGSGLASYVLTRATDYNTTNDIYAGTTIPVLVGGTANSDTQWTMSTVGNITIGSSNIAFIETSSGTSGTVTSVAASVPTFLSIAGSPITSSGTLAITLSGTALPVTSGGTGATTLTGLLQGNGTSAFTGITGTIGQFPYYNGTNTLLATSTISLSTGSLVGIGTTTPGALLDVYASAATSTVRIDTNSSTKGSCLIMKDATGGTYTYITSQDGVLTASTVACN